MPRRKGASQGPIVAPEPEPKPIPVDPIQAEFTRLELEYQRADQAERALDARQQAERDQARRDREVAADRLAEFLSKNPGREFEMSIRVRVKPNSRTIYDMERIT